MRTTLLRTVPFSRALVIGLGAALLLAGALLALALGLAPPVAIPQPARLGGDLSRVSEGGEVTVTATWLADQATPTFTVTLTTHSIDLDGYDLRTLATLRADGRTVAAQGWDAPAGGHHRAGTLVFPATASDGNLLIGADTRQVDLVIRGVGDLPERIFTWKR